MKFVFNEEKNNERRRMLMMQPTIEEGKALLAKDDTDAYAWYVYGKALSIQKEYEAAIEAHSHGIACDPFYAPNYFGPTRFSRGRTAFCMVGISMNSSGFTSPL